MISFLLQEGILSLGVISGVFTNNLLISLKSNIIDPLADKVVADNTLDRNGDGVVDEKDQQILEEQLKKNKKIRWQSFIKDLIVWIILMIILYILWNTVIKKIAPSIPKPSLVN
jgi:large-conductance mechanosensitive channel